MTKNFLAVPMDPKKNDAKAKTVGEYLFRLVETLWNEGEGFSGKRPFGNSGWEHELWAAFIKDGAVKGTLDVDGYVADGDKQAFHKVMEKALDQMFDMVTA